MVMRPAACGIGVNGDAAFARKAHRVGHRLHGAGFVVGELQGGGRRTPLSGRCRAIDPVSTTPSFETASSTTRAPDPLAGASTEIVLDAAE
jgi:hypothetical protein